MPCGRNRAGDPKEQRAVVVSREREVEGRGGRVGLADTVTHRTGKPGPTNTAEETIFSIL